MGCTCGCWDAGIPARSTLQLDACCPCIGGTSSRWGAPLPPVPFRLAPLLSTFSSAPIAFSADWMGLEDLEDCSSPPLKFIYVFMARDLWES